MSKELIIQTSNVKHVKHSNQANSQMLSNSANQEELCEHCAANHHSMTRALIAHHSTAIHLQVLQVVCFHSQPGSLLMVVCFLSSVST